MQDDISHDPQWQKDIAIPDGTRVIEAHQFMGREIRSVKVPASVREIGTEAFYNCRQLRGVMFVGES